MLLITLQMLALTLPKIGGRSDSVVRSRTRATELLLLITLQLLVFVRWPSSLSDCLSPLCRAEGGTHRVFQTAVVAVFPVCGS
jgi:hypothetical protein